MLRRANLEAKCYHNCQICCWAKLTFTCYSLSVELLFHSSVLSLCVF